MMIDELGPFDTLEIWEQHLKDLQALPSNIRQRDFLIDYAERMIARKKRGS